MAICYSSTRELAYIHVLSEVLLKREKWHNLKPNVITSKGLFHRHPNICRWLISKMFFQEANKTARTSTNITTSNRRWISQNFENNYQYFPISRIATIIFNFAIGTIVEYCPIQRIKSKPLTSSLAKPSVNQAQTFSQISLNLRQQLCFRKQSLGLNLPWRDKQDNS